MGASRRSTVDGPLSAGIVLLHGPIAKVLIATFLVALTIATRRGVLPAWARRGNVVVAVLNLAMVPSLFFGMNAAFVYAANGWGSVATMGAINMIWFGALGAAILRTRLDRTTTQSLAQLPAHDAPTTAARPA